MNRFGRPLRAQAFERLLHLLVVQGVQDDQFFPLALVAHGRDGEDLGGRSGGLLERFLDQAVRHHLAADLREPREPAGDLEEAVLAQEALVAGHVPAVVEGGARQVVAAQVAAASRLAL